MAYEKFMINAPHKTTTQAAKLEFLVITPNSWAFSAIGAAFAKPTFNKDDSNPHVTAINNPFNIFLDLLEELTNLSLSIPAFAVEQQKMG